MFRKTAGVEKSDLLHGSIAGPIMAFFLPILIGTLFQQLYNTVDAMVVGNYVGKEALSAVGGTTGVLINLLVGFVAGLASGSTVVVSQYFGSGNGQEVKKAVCTGMFLAIVLGVLIGVFGIALTPLLLSRMNIPESVFPLSVSYMRIYLSGMLPMMIYNNGAGVLRAVGDSKRPLYFLIVSCIVNIVLDLLFVAVLGMGVDGAAIATVLSVVISCVLTLIVLGRSTECYSYRLRETRFEKRMLKRIIAIGLPTGIQNVLYSVSNVFIQRSVNSFGVDTMAAFTAFGKLDALYWTTSGAFGTAAMTFIGQNFGAGNIDRVKKGFRVSLLLYALISATLSVSLYFGCVYLYPLFTRDAEVIRIGVALMRYLCPFWTIFMFVEIFSSGLRACGDSLVTTLITALGVGLFRIVWIYTVHAVTVFDTMRCYPVSWILTSALFIVYYLRGNWLKRTRVEFTKE
ncbi:MAG: MATE family efflux transporter [Erysipelotrichaceae bacterium]|nr:MATE family efflux transporter [Erysipelotrichaceae bacterium]